MFTVELSELGLLEGGYENDPTMRTKVNFPFSAATGTKNTTVVYFEIEPGHRLGTHTDSAEEILLILGGDCRGFRGRRAGAGLGRRDGAGACHGSPLRTQCGRRNVAGGRVLPKFDAHDHLRPTDCAHGRTTERTALWPEDIPHTATCGT
jgi:hypothetical protein